MTSKFSRYVSFIDIHALHSKWYIASILPKKKDIHETLESRMLWHEHQRMNIKKWATKKSPVCLGYTGDEILPSYVKIILNHDISIPIKQPVFHGFRIRLAFCFNRLTTKNPWKPTGQLALWLWFFLRLSPVCCLSEAFSPLSFRWGAGRVDGHSSEQSPKYYNGNSQEKPQIWI